MNLLESPLAVVGLGYVGLPLAVEFGKQYATIGYDIHAARVAELSSRVAGLGFGAPTVVRD